MLGLPLSALDELTFYEIDMCQYAYRNKMRRQDAAVERLIEIVGSALSGQAMSEDEIHVDPIPYEYTEDAIKANTDAFFKRMREHGTTIKEHFNIKPRPKLKSPPVAPLP